MDSSYYSLAIFMTYEFDLSMSVSDYWFISNYVRKGLSVVNDAASFNIKIFKSSAWNDQQLILPLK